MLKPQDLLVVLRLARAQEAQTLSYQTLSEELGISASEVHASVRRATESALLSPSRTVNRKNLLEFLLHGVRFAFPAKASGLTRGVPTSYAAPPLAKTFSVGEFPSVWPHPQGKVRGEGLAPLYRSVPEAALKNAQLHEWLALVDAVRAGRARERNLAAKELTRRLAS